MNRLVRLFGISLLVFGIGCNQWTLSLIFRENGFHVANVLEKSSGAWDWSSLILIWTFQIVCLVFGSIAVIYHQSPKKILLASAAFFSSTLFSLLFLEGIVRIISPSNMFSPELPLRPHNNLELRVTLDGVSPAVHNSTNKWGLRGDEPPANWDSCLTMIVIGGSTAQCFYLDDHKTWPYLLQEKLKHFFPDTWVGNGGLSGHSTRGHIVFVRNVMATLRPRVAIVLVGVNDLGFSMNDENRKYGNPAERTGWRHLLIHNSRLAQIASLWKIILVDHAVVLDRGASTNFVPEKLEHEIELPADIRSALPGLGEYTNNLRTIIGDLRTLHVRPLFLTQPLLFDTTKEWTSIMGRTYSVNGTKGLVSAATFAKMLTIYNQELLRVCGAEKVESLDLASKIPHSREYFYDLMHFNEKGADAVAETIAEYFRSHPPERN